LDRLTAVCVLRGNVRRLIVPHQVPLKLAQFGASNEKELCMSKFSRVTALVLGVLVLAVAISVWPAVATAAASEDRPAIGVMDTDDEPTPDTPPGGGSPGGEPDPPSKPPRPKP